jgi:hypothetical protein
MVAAYGCAGDGGRAWFRTESRREEGAVVESKW